MPTLDGESIGYKVVIPVDEELGHLGGVGKVAGAQCRDQDKPSLLGHSVCGLHECVCTANVFCLL